MTQIQIKPISIIAGIQYLFNSIGLKVLVTFGLYKYATNPQQYYPKQLLHWIDMSVVTERKLLLLLTASIENGESPLYNDIYEDKYIRNIGHFRVSCYLC
jgi:hypothetical protein